MQTIIALTIVASCAAVVLRGLARAVLPSRRAKACGCNGCPALKDGPAKPRATPLVPVPVPVPSDRRRPAA
jgi:hypothetical protein